MPATKPLGELRGHGEHDGEVGLPLPCQRGRDGDDDRVGLANGVVVGRRAQRSSLDERRDGLARDVLDIALASLDPFDLGDVDVDQHGCHPGLGEDLGERDADIAGADDGELTLHRSAHHRSDQGLGDPLGGVAVAVQPRMRRGRAGVGNGRAR